MSDNAENFAKTTAGVVNELAKRGGVNTNIPEETLGHGKLIVEGVSKLAPGAVAAASAYTVATMSTASATAVALAPVVVPVAIVGTVGYGAYKLFKWCSDS